MIRNDPMYAQFLKSKLAGQKANSPALDTIYYSTASQIEAYLEELE